MWAHENHVRFILRFGIVLEKLWLPLNVSLIAEAEMPDDLGTQLCVDNRAACAWYESERSMRKAKHVDIGRHFVKEVYKRGSMQLAHVPSEGIFPMNSRSRSTEPNLSFGEIGLVCDLMVLRAL